MFFLPKPTPVTFIKRPAKRRQFTYYTIAKAPHVVRRYDFTDGQKPAKTIRQQKGTTDLLLPYCWDQTNTDRPITIVEGEKCVHFLRHDRPKANAITWAGGCNGWEKTDWSVLHGTTIILIPDNDDPGWKVMYNIGQLCVNEYNCTAFILDYNRDTYNSGWDIADFPAFTDLKKASKTWTKIPIETTAITFTQPITIADDSKGWENTETILNDSDQFNTLKATLRIDTDHGTNHFKAYCPIHKNGQEKTASLSVRMLGEKLQATCFGCGAKTLEILEHMGLKNNKIVPPVHNAITAPPLDATNKAIQEATKTSNFKLVMKTYKELMAKPPEWLIPHWLQKGQVNLLSADSGQGKTTLALKIAAMITTGTGTFGTGTNAIKYNAEPGGVIYFTNEGHAVDDIKPSFVAQGGDTTRLWNLTIQADNRTRNFLPSSENQLDALIDMIKNVPPEEHKIKLFILDPILSLLDSPKDEYSAVAIRKKMAKLTELILETNLTILGIKHFLKRSRAQGGQAKDQDAGSAAWLEFSRVNMVLMHRWRETEDDQPERQQFLLKTQANKATNKGAWKYKLNLAHIEMDNYWFDDTLLYDFTEFHPHLTADDLMSESPLPPKPKDNQQKINKKETIKTLFITYLTQQHKLGEKRVNGTHMMNWIHKELQKLNLTANEDYIKKARTELVKQNTLEWEKDSTNQLNYWLNPKG